MKYIFLITIKISQNLLIMDVWLMQYYINEMHAFKDLYIF